MTFPIIAPSILSSDHARLGEEIQAVERAGADRIHVDVMDGHFVPNLTLGPPVIASLRKTTKLPFGVHLMIEKPELSLEQYARAGANRIFVHVEASIHLDRTLHHIRELGAGPGVTLNPSTPLASIVNVLHIVDAVLVMTVNPGFGGQSLIPEVLPKIRAIKKLAVERGLDFEIEVDGGIEPETAGRVTAAGADVLISGSAVFGSQDYAQTIAALREAGRANPYDPSVPVDFRCV